MLELNRIYNMDCLDGMRQLEDKSIDLVITDPPYGVNFEYNTYQDTDENWKKLFNKIIPEFKRISKMTILPSCQIKKLEYIYKTYPPDWLICWYKGSPGHSAYIGFNDWEPLLVYGKNNTHMHDYFYCQPAQPTMEHPCPKPIEWAEWIIERTTKKNDIICDPFIGSGTSAVAAIKLSRVFVGFELDKRYFDAAQTRIKKAQEQSKIGAWFE